MTILSCEPALANTSEEFFDPRLTVDARFAGGSIAITPEHVDWLGDTLVRVEIPGADPVMLRTFEARDLALQLLNSAAHIDEEPRRIRRTTEPGTPDQCGIGGGL